MKKCLIVLSSVLLALPLTTSRSGTIKKIIPESVQVGKPFTDFSATTIDGNLFSLKETVAQ